ncbi:MULTISPECIES: DUF4304 domain-containing protein [unclassified Phenylobacterium]|jgi:hypothetical protein|uniref:DUF4304 domain-containing protein n=1 Tax=unclassified Phenylobacterium TaxID=2640670 RepID=UPI00083B91EF|nr:MULTISPECIES: DUF4304 domain-containing protein [unclassified Phenylobacterium]
MSGASYIKALDRALTPLGFVRESGDWVRRRGEIQDQVDLQKSSIDGGVTVNLFAKNLETERILKSIPCEKQLGTRQFGQRIGELIDGRDRWWKNDPEGPAEVTEAVLLHGIPWFECVRSLEDEASVWYGRGTTGFWRKPNLTVLAVTLFRLGALEEALALFQEPVPKTAIPTLVTEGRCVQRWLQDQTITG